jgi:glycosyltransferase involved in cell wall biosynthesis
MKIQKIGIYLESGPACGGSYQYNRFLLRALADICQDKIELVTFVAAEHWHKTAAEYQLKIIPASFSSLWKKLAALWRRSKMPLAVWHWLAKRSHPLARKLIQEKCDIVIFPSQDALTYLMPVPTIGVIHDLMHRYERQFPEVGNKKEFCKREFHYQNICEWSKAILVDSELGRSHAEESYLAAKDKCHSLPFITSVEESSDNNIRQKYSLPSQYFFYPAQFWQHKNHIRLLTALYNAIQQYPEMQLVLVGSPKNGYDEVLATIDKLELKNNVKILGLVPDEDMAGLYQNARALIMPTFFGPTNIPPLEAFALGCPVAVSGIYAMPELYQDAALYFDPSDMQAIKSVMIKLWRDDALCDQLREKGRLKHNHWHFPNFKSRLENILRNVV